MQRRGVQVSLETFDIRQLWHRFFIAQQVPIRATIMRLSRDIRYMAATKFVLRLDKLLSKRVAKAEHPKK